MAAAFKRRFPRVPACHAAELRRGADLYVGTILDTSDTGVFFRPEAGVIDGVFTQIERDTGLAPGAAVLLRRDDQPAPATVRWGGWSERHRCRGVGLETHA